MRKIIYACIFCLLILTACGNQQAKERKSDENKNTEETNLYKSEELIESMKGVINSEDFKNCNDNEKQSKLEELLIRYMRSGEILNYKLDIKTDRPCFSVTFKDGRKDIFLIEDFPENEN